MVSVCSFTYTFLLLKMVFQLIGKECLVQLFIHKLKGATSFFLLSFQNAKPCLRNS